MRFKKQNTSQLPILKFPIFFIPTCAFVPYVNFSRQYTFILIYKAEFITYDSRRFSILTKIYLHLSSPQKKGDEYPKRKQETTSTPRLRNWLIVIGVRYDYRPWFSKYSNKQSQTFSLLFCDEFVRTWFVVMALSKRNLNQALACFPGNVWLKFFFVHPIQRGRAQNMYYLCSYSHIPPVHHWYRMWMGGAYINAIRTVQYHRGANLVAGFHKWSGQILRAPPRPLDGR